MILLKLTCSRALTCFVSLFLFFPVHSSGVDDCAIPLHSDVRSPSSLERSVEDFQMGIEVETHGIKIQNTDEDDILVILQSLDGKWQLTSDTHDVRIDGTNWVNLECRTVGGLSEEEVRKYTGMTFKFMSEIKGTCDSIENGQWKLRSSNIPRPWLEIVNWMLPPEKTMVFSTKKQNAITGAFEIIDFNVRPQLSFSFPLRYMKEVFLRVLGQEQNRDCVMPRLLDAQKQHDVLTSRMFREKKESIRAFLDIGLADHLGSKKDFRTIDGFSLLLSSYVYDLFVLNQEPKISIAETGPKAFLKVVSRVSFSDMFKQLNEPDQKELVVFFEEFRPFFDRPVKPYKKDAPGTCYEESVDEKGTLITERERICLGLWLQTIREPIKRNGQEISQDLLSPPPYTEKSYSMGAVNIGLINHNHALIEARGYHELKPFGQNISLDNFGQLILNEAAVFFSLGQSRGLGGF